MFIDTAIIRIRAGNGGNGSVSFRRAKYVPKGGPDGGNGGAGGDVIFQADDGLNTLVDFRHKVDWSAQDGEHGRGRQQYGRAAEDTVIKVPAGTLVYNQDTSELVADIGPGDRIVIAKGGRGGFGNEHYKNSVNQAPRKAEPGEPGEAFTARLELKLIAEVGLVGLPNAGKSTLLSALTRADAKVGAYPFTTLSPQLGIAQLDEDRRIVIADIPGLIEGAAQGAGLGHDFLRHIERTRVILHLVDAAPLDESNPAENYLTIRGELAGYSPELAEKPEIIAINKLDLLPEDERAGVVGDLCATLKLGADQGIVAISGAAAIGLPELLDMLWNQLHPKGAEVPGW